MARIARNAVSPSPLLLAGAALLALPALAPSALAQVPDARPQGGAEVAGQARITQTPRRTQVDQSSPRAVIEWRGFDIGANHQVENRQADAGAWSLQRVVGPDPSAIAGRLTSNGGVAIVNPAGIVFHHGAQVEVAALIATASDTTNQAFMAGRMAFDGAPRPGARVENHGTITLRNQGLAALVGPVAANSGTIRARLGRVAIAEAEALTIDLAGDGLLSFDVTRQVAGGRLAANPGTIAAEGGHVPLTAQAASGLLESVVEAGARIAARDIVAHAPGGEVRVPAGAVLDASGASGGGRVTVGAAPGSAIRAPLALAARMTVETGATLRADATEAGDVTQALTDAGLGITGGARSLCLRRGRAGVGGQPGCVAGGRFGGSRLRAGHDRRPDGARRPVLILDSRAAGLAAIPDFVAPDLPGQAAAAQPTQLERFGAPGNLPAADVVFDIAAGEAPVFLLVDAGPVLGALEAGRLGVLGQGGSAARASAAGAPASYRFNECPMGLAGCGALPPGGGGIGGGLASVGPSPGPLAGPPLPVLLPAPLPALAEERWAEAPR